MARKGSTEASSSLRNVLAMALRNGRLDASRVHDEAAFVRAAIAEGVLPLLAWRLREAPMPPDLQARMASANRQAAVYALFRKAELQKVAGVLARSGIKALLLKGNALGEWLYPEPFLRVTSDIDLLFASRAHAEQAASLFTEFGYEQAFSPAASSYEMTCRLRVDGVNRSELDLHWRLVNAPVYAGIFSFNELWGHAIALPTLGGGLKALCPDHALAHACLNRALDMQIGMPDALKLVYDLHLLVERMDAADWRGFLELATRKNLCGICLRSLDDTVAAFGTPLPEAARHTLARHAAREPISGARLDDWRHMQWHNLKAIPGTWAKLAWLRDKVFPTGSHLRELHGDGNWLQLMWRRGVRGLRRLLG